jgi:hypothetical protein
MPPDGKSINTYLPSELVREIFLYSIESNQMKSGHLASVCRYWRFVITTMSHLWSTLRVGTWTEREQVATWAQRAYPKKVVIDTQRDDQVNSITPFAALQDALGNTSQWNELIISSFRSENLAIQPDFQGAKPMIALRALHVVAECVNSPLFTHLLDLVPTEAPLSELGLHSSFSMTYFLQPHWYTSLQNLTVFIVNGRDIHEPFDLLPVFTQLHTFEANHLPLPFYELDTNLPLLCTLRKLRLRASSVQWMAGRRFQCLEECAILVPHHKEAVQQHEVQLPSCRKLTYHGYPTTTAQYFHVPQVRAMELGSHDCREQRVYEQLHHLCTLDERISNLTILHLTLQCNEQGFVKLLKHLGSLQELVLSIAYPSLSWKHFLESLAAKPSTRDWPKEVSDRTYDQQWEQWYSSQTWHAKILPHLKYLGIQSPKGFSRSECHDNSPLLRLVGWTRAQLTPPLEHLKVWEGRRTIDDIAVDYISTGYLDKHPEMSSNENDMMVIRGMLTQRLVLYGSATSLLQLHSTTLFRRLQYLEVNGYSDIEIPILPSLEQIKRLDIWHGTIPAYSLNIDFPLIHTLQWLRLGGSTFSWMIGRSFKVLREFWADVQVNTPENLSAHEGLQADLPACTTLKLGNFSVNHLHFLSCPNVQMFEWTHSSMRLTIDKAASKELHDFFHDCPSLQKLEIFLSQDLGLDPLIQFVFYDAWEEGVWRDIRSVQVTVWFERSDFCSRVVGHHHHYGKWWKELSVTKEDPERVVVRASI